tara:strand:- start:1633 stop:2367 length:735 start_codon:yes stop_codon:yes gene_type:complete
MSITRVIPRLDIKNEFVIKGIHLEGLRKIGDPNLLAKKYYHQGADEIIFMDAVAAYYDRNSLSHIIEKACEDVFIPITVGGGIRSIEDIQSLLNAGADKVAINTHAIRNPNFINEASRIFGSQCIVASVEAKKINEGKYLAYYDNGRESTDYDVFDWLNELVDRGAGEVMLTSIDNEGTNKGFDINLSKLANETVSVPIISSGGCGDLEHIENLINETHISGVSVASILHYDKYTIEEIKNKIK